MAKLGIFDYIYPDRDFDEFGSKNEYQSGVLGQVTQPASEGFNLLNIDPSNLIYNNNPVSAFYSLPSEMRSNILGVEEKRQEVEAMPTAPYKGQFAIGGGEYTNETPLVSESDITDYGDAYNKQISNLDKNIAEVNLGILEMASKPEDVVQTGLNLTSGVMQNITGVEWNKEDIAMADAVAKSIVNDFGSFEGFKKALYERPVDTGGMVLGGSYLTVAGLRKLQNLADTSGFADLVDKASRQLPETQMSNRSEMFGSLVGLERTGKLDLVDKAQKMEAEGASPEQIWNTHGLIRGLDDKWRYEFDDSKMELTLDDVPKNPLNTRPLEQVIKHPTLFNTYPELRELKVAPFKYQLPERTGGAFHGDHPMYGQLIEMNPTKMDDKKTYESYLAHEIQHAIQRIEGTARGGSPRNETSLIMNTGYPAEVKRKFEEGTERVQALIPFINKASNRFEYISDSDLEDIGYPKNMDRQTAYRNASEELRQLQESNQDLYWEYASLGEKARAEGFENYKKLAGEAEAFEAQDRFNLSETERQGLLPAFQNVSKEDAIVRFDDVTNLGKIGDDDVQKTTTRGLQDEGSVRGILGMVSQEDVIRKPEYQRYYKERETDGSLVGLPRNVGRENPAKASPIIQDQSRQYAEQKGLEYKPVNEFVEVDEEYSTKVANAFEEMDHNPRDPKVLEAYNALIDETIEQYKVMLDNGLKVEYYPKDFDPYPNPWDAIDDINNNNHLYIFPTKQGFGSDVEFDVTENPLLRDTEFRINGEIAPANDIFRAVHDYFGHAKEGVGFRASGEENAFIAHSSMYSPLAQKALATETRGQNSWLNFGKFGEKNREAGVEDTIFADQKIGLLPDEFTNPNYLTNKSKGLLDEVTDKASQVWSAKEIDIDQLMPIREGGAGVKGDRSVTNRPLADLSGDTLDSPTRVKELKKQIQEEGLNKPLVVSYDPSNGRIRLEEGNHRLSALKELGYDKVPVEILRKDFSADFFSNMQTTKANLKPTLKNKYKTLSGKETIDTAIDPEDVFKNIDTSKGLLGNVATKNADEGKKIIAYHSSDEDFDKFDFPQIGYHFGANPELSKQASIKSGKRDPKVQKYELDIKNPFVIEKANLSPSGWSPYQLLDNMDEGGLIRSQREYDEILDDLYDLEEQLGAYKIDDQTYARKIKDYYKKLLGSKGYDGIKYWNEFDASPTYEQLMTAKPDGKGGLLVEGQLEPDWSYIALSNKQIKKVK